MSSATLTELEARYQFACEVARAAGSRAMSWYQQRNQLVAEYKKDLQDLVSEADRNVEELIRHLILERFPEDAVIGEESGGDAGQARFIWVVDPIDGTSNFLSGLHNWCVALAIVCEGEPVIGVVCDPNHQEIFHACRGKGAWMNEQRIRAHSAGQLSQGLFGLGCSTSQPAAPLLDFISALLQQGGMFIRNGSGALMSAWAAAGRLTGYYEARMQPWDGLPGIVLMREAGGETNRYEQNNGLTQGNPVLLANATLWPQINALLAEPLT
ncbi:MULTISPECIES: inositol monophosphatase family protein [Pantoea]|jgi:myo-inositol-1(or 4)-monophosphatase|uniref:Inositol monophosphatase n=1 Tax=Pantoea eucrina TaxID=472693 RepID=A0ABS1Z4U0_9GAMM|nr:MULTISPECIES: inositol monophosphatase [Pantoea]PPS58065.1 inositol monophosphatase [Pantoea sp. BRM17]AIX50433.1 inositol monophosphatase [Pantoea sp. PSNIH1]MBM0746960.1 inositol monophosphatase [Pantoea eucrina]MCL9646548.1 inositol monophosphatase [Pantoea eucrina]MDJ0025160.1 inositol monophosphatase [Pantoea eucrina]